MTDGMIRTAADLAAICAKAKEEGLLSLDTEFVWRSTYRPQLGLVQAGTRGSAAAIDCLAGFAPSALGEILADASVVKILHDARQDLTHLRHYTGAYPVNVFDTQLAAAFAGFPGGIGLQKLLFDAIGVGLPKTETLTDWMRRPLTAAQIEYALDDVRYLPALMDELLKRCDAAGTRAWLEEDLAKYDDPSLYADACPQEAWKRIKTGRAKLDSRAFAVLRSVAALREELAREWNIPRTWAGDDPSLVRMALEKRVSHLAHRLRGSLGDVARAKYSKSIASAMALPEEECPSNPRPHYIREVQEAADEALAWLRAKADAIRIDPGLIASRATVTAFVDDAEDETNPLASGWRAEVAGREMASRFAVE
ncbi:MAG: hypothetical protein K6F50_10570 [Kiritimatiellae bacterium]|nr:hypothetical protein [Kiritimatiellia bacterium]